MSQAFNSEEFLARIGRRLVIEFDDASQAGTPSLIGSAREHPARRSLEKVLPGVAGVGTGLVIDSYGGQSRQQDIVIYERPWCPIFSINETPDATYFPCEGVIATGEIKSQLGTKELEDAFEKVASVKRLRRHALATRSELLTIETVSFRKFGSAVAFDGTKDEEFDQIKKSSDQIFSFILCGEFKSAPESTLQKAVQLWKQYARTESPNVILSLKDGFLRPYKSEQNQIVQSSQDADAIAFYLESNRAMGYLISLLNSFIRSARTVETNHFQRYFMTHETGFARGGIAAL